MTFYFLKFEIRACQVFYGCNNMKQSGLDVPILRYKHLFGENYSVSGLRLYACAQLLKKNEIPFFLYASDQRVEHLKSILLLNQTREGDVSMILLKKA